MEVPLETGLPVLLRQEFEEAGEIRSQVHAMLVPDGSGPLLEVEEVQVERLHRDLDLPHRKPERDDHQDEARREEGLSGSDLPEEEDEHAEDADEKARDARGLHALDQVNPVPEVVDLPRDERVGVLAVPGVEAPDERREREEAVRVGEEKERDRGKEERGGGEAQLHVRHTIADAPRELRASSGVSTANDGGGRRCSSSPHPPNAPARAPGLDRNPRPGGFRFRIRPAPRLPDHSRLAG